MYTILLLAYTTNFKMKEYFISKVIIHLNAMRRLPPNHQQQK